MSLGYFSKRADAVAFGRGATEVVRRLTGGGLVDHSCDSTFALVLPWSAGGDWCRGSEASYAWIHGALADALASVGIGATLDGGQSRRTGGGACFENPVRSDILYDGRKIVGGAQKRTARGLLHQGSIQLHGGARVPETVFDRFAERIATKIVPFDRAPAEVGDRATELVATRYATEAWTAKY